MPRTAREPSRTVFECRESFAVFRGGIPDVFPAGRQVLADDPILRSHRPFFVEAADLVADQSPTPPGDRAPQYELEQEDEVGDA